MVAASGAASIASTAVGTRGGGGAAAERRWRGGLRLGVSVLVSFLWHYPLCAGKRVRRPGR